LLNNITRKKEAKFLLAMFIAGTYNFELNLEWVSEERA